MNPPRSPSSGIDSDDRLRRSDMKLFEKAMNQRWPIEDRYRAAMIRRLMAIVADPDSTAREITAASRALIAAEAQNQHDEEPTGTITITGPGAGPTEPGGNRFFAIAERLGINVDPGTIDAGGASSNDQAADGSAGDGGQAADRQG